MLLFSDRSIWTMIHGIVLGGAGLLALAAALFYMRFVAEVPGAPAALPAQARYLTRATVFVAVALWLGVLVGTYIVFPLYRTAPPPDVTDLTAYPRALILGNADTAWLHAFAMEIKEHVPWIASMLATAVAFVGLRYRDRLLNDPALRRMSAMLLALCFVLVSLAGVLGIFVNKVAPLE